MSEDWSEIVQGQRVPHAKTHNCGSVTLPGMRSMGVEGSHLSTVIRTVNGGGQTIWMNPDDENVVV